MNVISFSLWGNEPKYCTGLLRNLELAPKIYPDWTCFVWMDKRVPQQIHDAAIGLGAVVKKPPCPNGMFWRFFALGEPGVERFISRDLDSRLNLREAQAVSEWVASGLAFHVIRDHPRHVFPIPGGLWGATRDLDFGLIDRIRQCIESQCRDGVYSTDQYWLARDIWPLVRGQALSHDFCNRHLFGGREFPATFGDWRFCGEVFDENDVPNPNHWQQRINWMTQCNE